MFLTSFRPRSLKKTLSIFTKISDPGYAKKFKNHKNSQKIYFAWNNLKCITFSQQHHLRCFGQVSGKYLSKKNLVNSHKNLWPQVCKKIQKIMKKRKKLFFPRNNLKYLSLRQQHHLRCFGQVSDQNLSKKTWSIFTKISGPGYAKKFKKSWK